MYVTICTCTCRYYKWCKTTITQLHVEIINSYHWTELDNLLEHNLQSSEQWCSLDRHQKNQLAIIAACWQLACSSIVIPASSISLIMIGFCLGLNFHRQVIMVITIIYLSTSLLDKVHVLCDIQNIQGGDNAYQDLHYSGYYWKPHPLITTIIV